MSRKRVKRPEPATKTVKIKNVPSEIADLFNWWVELNSDEWVESRRTKEGTFSELVLKTATECFGKDSVERHMRSYRDTQALRKGAWLRYDNEPN